MRATSRQVAVKGEPGAPLLTVLVVDSESPGPTVTVTANVHGDELTGLVAVHQLFERLPSELLTGRVLLFPSLNPAGLAAGQRTLPSDGGDLNRCFPGRRRGRRSERAALAAWNVLLDQRPDVLIDLHADALRSIPYAITDRVVALRGSAQEALEAELLTLAEQTGLTVIQEYPAEKYRRFSLDRSLAGAMVNVAGIPAITIEAGPRRAATEGAVEASVWAVRRVLGARGMLGQTLSAHASQVCGGPWRRAATPRVQSGGWLRPMVAAGGRFEAGETLAEVFALDGKRLEELRAPRAGLVVSWADVGWLTIGAVAGTLALEEN